MTDRIGFDRPLRRDWLDFLASTLASGTAAPEALSDTRRLVAQSVADPGTPHGAAGKTMTLLKRIWVTVPDDHRPLRDQALSVIGAAGPDSRLAAHWAMCELAYPFYLDVAAAVGRTFDIQDTVALGQIRARLSERWGARGTLPQAVQRILKMWHHWGTLEAADAPGRYHRAEPIAIDGSAASVLAEARVRSSPTGVLDLDSLQRASDLFPFALHDLRGVVRRHPGLALMRQGGQGWVVRATQRSEGG